MSWREKRHLKIPTALSEGIALNVNAPRGKSAALQQLWQKQEKRKKKKRKKRKKINHDSSFESAKLLPKHLNLNWPATTTKVT